MLRVAVVLVTVGALAGLSHARTANPCLAGKLKCVTQKAQSLLTCHEKAAVKGVNDTTDPKTLQCLQKARGKFGGCFGRVKGKGGAICSATPDAAAMEAKVDAFVLDVVNGLKGP